MDSGPSSKAIEASATFLMSTVSTSRGVKHSENVEFSPNSIGYTASAGNTDADPRLSVTAGGLVREKSET